MKCFIKSMGWGQLILIAWMVYVGLSAHALVADLHRLTCEQRSSHQGHMLWHGFEDIRWRINIPVWYLVGTRDTHEHWISQYQGSEEQFLSFWCDTETNTINLTRYMRTEEGGATNPVLRVFDRPKIQFVQFGLVVAQEFPTTKDPEAILMLVTMVVRNAHNVCGVPLPSEEDVRSTVTARGGDHLANLWREHRILGVNSGMRSLVGFVFLSLTSFGWWLILKRLRHDCLKSSATDGIEAPLPPSMGQLVFSWDPAGQCAAYHRRVERLIHAAERMVRAHEQEERHAVEQAERTSKLEEIHGRWWTEEERRQAERQAQRQQELDSILHQLEEIDPELIPMEVRAEFVEHRARCSRMVERGKTAEALLEGRSAIASLDRVRIQPPKRKVVKKRKER